MEATRAEILIPMELQYSDLLLLSSSPSSLSLDEISRLDLISDSIMQTLGPLGPGLLSVAGVPGVEDLRRALLPLTRELALLGSKDRARILKEHGLGSDVPLKDPCRTVSSFAAQLKYGQDPSSKLFSGDPRCSEEGNGNAEENPTINNLQEVPDPEFKRLGSMFRELGHCMMEIGLRLACICDKAIGIRELEQSILDSCTAKGRVIHYHSMIDSLILKGTNSLKGTNRRSKATTKNAGPTTHTSSVPPEYKASGYKGLPEQERLTSDKQHKLEIKPHTDNDSIKAGCWRTCLSNLWQQWHHDYGIFTILTAPLFISSVLEDDRISNQLCSSPDGHTYLQLFDATDKKILAVKSSAESFIIQVGEAADILSGGRLRSTLHSVGRPVENENVSRETFVIFLQPSWSKILSYPDYLSKSEIDRGTLTSVNETSSKSQQLVEEILKKIPPLSSRLRDGMTFAEFSRETTKQYYGGSGTQSRNKRCCYESPAKLNPL